MFAHYIRQKEQGKDSCVSYMKRSPSLSLLTNNDDERGWGVLEMMLWKGSI